MRVNIGLGEEARAAVANLLDTLLADTCVLATKTRNYHWNVTGGDFVELHDLFQRQYAMLDAAADDIAERARTLGAPARGSLTEFQQATRLTESPGRMLNGREMVAELLHDHELVIRHLREDLHDVETKYVDAGTAGMLASLLERHEKTAWMLRAVLEG